MTGYLPSRQNRAWQPAALVIGRSGLLVLGIAALRLATRQGSLHAGDNMADIVQSNVDIVLFGLGVVGFTLVAVVRRGWGAIPIWVGLLECGLVGFLALWPQTNGKVSVMLSDMGEAHLNYQGLLPSGRPARSLVFRFAGPRALPWG